MSRRDEVKKENPNPAEIWLEWKSDKKCFQYWDKSKESNVEVSLPLKFLWLKEMHTVKGWHDDSESGIYSNEVAYIGTEELKVRSFKGGPIVEGVYKQIKPHIIEAGGYYVKSIYAMLESGQLVNIQLKGSAAGEWGEFTKKTKNRLPDEWVAVEESEQRKKGATTYNVPLFKFATSLSKSDDEKAEQVYATLKMYMDAYLDSNNVEKEVKSAVQQYEEGQMEPAPMHESAGEEVDDLPF